MKETKTVVFRLAHEEYNKINRVAEMFHINRSSILRISVAKLLADIDDGHLILNTNNSNRNQEKSNFEKLESEKISE